MDKSNQTKNHSYKTSKLHESKEKFKKSKIHESKEKIRLHKNAILRIDNKKENIGLRTKNVDTKTTNKILNHSNHKSNSTITFIKSNEIFDENHNQINEKPNIEDNRSVILKLNDDRKTKLLR